MMMYSNTRRHESIVPPTQSNNVSKPPALINPPNQCKGCSVVQSSGRCRWSAFAEQLNTTCVLLLFCNDASTARVVPQLFTHRYDRRTVLLVVLFARSNIDSSQWIWWHFEGCQRMALRTLRMDDDISSSSTKRTSGATPSHQFALHFHISGRIHRDLLVCLPESTHRCRSLRQPIMPIFHIHFTLENIWSRAAGPRFVPIRFN